KSPKVVVLVVLPSTLTSHSAQRQQCHRINESKLTFLPSLCPSGAGVYDSLFGAGGWRVRDGEDDVIGGFDVGSVFFILRMSTHDISVWVLHFIGSIFSHWLAVRLRHSIQTPSPRSIRTGSSHDRRRQRLLHSHIARSRIATLTRHMCRTLNT